MKKVTALLALVLALALAPVAGAKRASADAIVHEIQRAFGKHANTAICEAVAESTGQYWRPGMKPHFNPNAVSDTDDHGLFQFHHGLQMYGRQVYNAYFNIQTAKRWTRGGVDWSSWTGTYGRGMCHGLG